MGGYWFTGSLCNEIHLSSVFPDLFRCYHFKWLLWKRPEWPSTASTEVFTTISLSVSHIWCIYKRPRKSQCGCNGHRILWSNSDTSSMTLLHNPRQLVHTLLLLDVLPLFVTEAEHNYRGMVQYFHLYSQWWQPCWGTESLCSHTRSRLEICSSSRCCFSGWPSGPAIHGYSLSTENVKGGNINDLTGITIVWQQRVN